MRCFPGVSSCEKHRIQVSPVPACGINEDLFACMHECRFSRVPNVKTSEFLSVLYKFEVVVRINCLRLDTGRTRYTIWREGPGNDRGEEGGNEGRKESGGEKTWSDKEETAGRCIVIL
ncbi:hypothetical protein TNCV_542521 [Trichonephila clavipes]|nr:hypothetical protein TNCV_542521 [Trichonephila clavipes]